MSELIGAPVVDPARRPIGVVRDVRVTAGPGFTVTGITIGQPGWIDAAAHAWGFALGRASGPWPLWKLTRPAVRRSRFVPVDRVRSWGPGQVVVSDVPGAPDAPGTGRQA